MNYQENIFFDLKKLKSVGKNVIIGKTVRIRYPELVEIGNNVIIDDFTYISTQLHIKSNVHIAAGCKIIGGKKAYVEIKDFCALAPNVTIAAGSDDYTSGIIVPMHKNKNLGYVVIGKVIIGKHSVIGANSVILPNVIVSEGASLGALSLAKNNLKEWSIYAGVPAIKIKDRDKLNIIKLEKQYYDESKNE